MWKLFPETPYVFWWGKEHPKLFPEVCFIINLWAGFPILHFHFIQRQAKVFPINRVMFSPLTGTHFSFSRKKESDEDYSFKTLPWGIFENSVLIENQPISWGCSCSCVVVELGLWQIFLEGKIYIKYEIYIEDFQNDINQ